MATPRRPARSNSRYFLRFAGTAGLLVSGTLVLVLYVLPQRYVLSSGFREGSLALPNPSIPFEPADPLRVAALPPIPPAGDIVRGPAELFWEQVLPLIEQGRYDDAIPVFAAYLAEYPGDLGVRREYGITLARGGYRDRAISVFESLLARDDDVELRLLLARTLRDAGRVDEAARHYRAVMARTPGDEALLMEWARAHMSIEQYAPAETILLRGAEVFPDSVAVRVELARLYFYTDRLGEAEAILSSLTDEELAQHGASELRDAVVAALTPPPPPEAEPPPPPTLLDQAIAAREDDDFARARELFEAALREGPDDAEAWRAYADFLQFETEDFDGALAALGEVERITGGRDPALQFRMAQLEIWTDRTGPARDRLEALLLLLDADEGPPPAPAAPGSPATRPITRADVYALLGDLDRWDGDRLAAVGRYEQALAEDGAHEPAREGLAVLQAEVDRQLVETEEPRMGAIAESVVDTDDYRRLDLGGEWRGIDDEWVWGTRAGARFLEGVDVGGGPSDARGSFVELEGGRWWRWGTVRTALHLGLQNVQDSRVDLSFGASARLGGAAGRRTDLRLEHAPAFGATNTVQAVQADVRQDALSVTHAQPLGARWSLGASGEVASLDHRALSGGDRNLRVSAGLSVGRAVSRTITLGLAGRGLTYVDPAPVLTTRLYWDPGVSVAVGPYARYTRPVGTWWTVDARVNPGLGWIDERSATGGEFVPDLSANLALRREGPRYLTRIELFYGQGRFDAYRSFRVNLGFSARGWFGRGDPGGSR